jgi:nicotinate-nucleotide pyrophosphorylase (carboxylating)
MIPDFQHRLEELVTSAIAEDVGNGDHSTLSTIPAGAAGRAVLKIKEDGILAGVDVARRIFQMLEPGSELQISKRDGEEMRYGEEAFIVQASVHTILKAERLVLNIMQRMSGISTLTRTYTRKLEGFHTRLLDTRKTTPNFRVLEKEAVRIGGGVNHRFGLFDMIMLKDNHIDFCGGIEQAIERAHTYVQRVDPMLKIEVETRSLDDVRKVVQCGRGKVFRIMLDNFNPAQIREALPLIEGAFETEASGGINLDNIVSYAETGVDYVSVGALIHQARSVDLSLKAIK